MICRLFLFLYLYYFILICFFFCAHCHPVHSRVTYITKPSHPDSIASSSSSSTFCRSALCLLLSPRQPLPVYQIIPILPALIRPRWTRKESSLKVSRRVFLVFLEKYPHRRQYIYMHLKAKKKKKKKRPVILIRHHFPLVFHLVWLVGRHDLYIPSCALTRRDDLISDGITPTVSLPATRPRHHQLTTNSLSLLLSSLHSSSLDWFCSLTLIVSLLYRLQDPVFRKQRQHKA